MPGSAIASSGESLIIQTLRARERVVLDFINRACLWGSEGKDDWLLEPDPSRSNAAQTEVLSVANGVGFSWSVGSFSPVARIALSAGSEYDIRDLSRPDKWGA